MSYTPTNWKAGDTVTSAKLNKMEQGIANGTLVVHLVWSNEGKTATMDKTWQQIYDADSVVVIDRYEEDGELHSIHYPVVQVGYGSKVSYFVEVEDKNNTFLDFQTETANSYPAHSYNTINK